MSQVDRMTVTERCPGRIAGQACHRRAAHHGHCAHGGSYAQALDELHDVSQQLAGAVDAFEEFIAAVAAPTGRLRLAGHEEGEVLYEMVTRARAALGGQ
jgi:hypothetical protein